MAVTIADGDLSLGGAVLESSGGTKYAVFVALNVIEVWSSIDGTPNLDDSDTAATVHGGDNIAWVDAAIDGSDNIHIVSSCDAEQTRDVAYAVFAAGSIGAWEEAADYEEQAPTNARCSISLDSNGIAHVLYADNIKIGGQATDQCDYCNRIGGGWGVDETVNATAAKGVPYDAGELTKCAADDVEAFYYYRNTGDPAWRRRNAGWGGETAYTETDAVIGTVIATTGDTIYRYHTDTNQNIEENNVDTTYNSHAVQNRVSAALSANDGTTRYVFYIDTSDDVHVICNEGAGWTDLGAQQTGTYLYVIAEWAYNFERQSGEINYIFDDGTDVFYDSFELPEVAVPTFAYVMI